jgi:hypothetical protein
MSKNLYKKGLALGTVLALGVTGLTGVAATAASGDVTIAPLTGTKYGAFSTDTFKVKTTVVNTVSPSTLAYKIDSADHKELLIKVVTNESTPNPANDVKLIGINSLGATVAINSGNAIAIDGTDDDGTFAVKFNATSSEFTSLIVIPLWDSANATATSTIEVTPLEAVATSSSVATDLLTAATVYLDTVAANVPDRLDYADGDVSVGLTAWVETGSDYTTVDSAFASSTQTINWYDPKSTSIIPRVERFVNSNGAELNDAGNDLAGSIEFTKPVNLDQVDLAKWNYKVAQSDGTAIVAETALVAGDATKAVGYDKHDDFGRILAIFPKADNLSVTLDATKDYVVSIASTGTGSTYFSSVAYGLPKNDAAADQIQATVTDGDNALQTDSDDTSISLRAGTKSFTYKAQIKTADATAAETASIQVLAIVKAGSYLPAGGSYTISGASAAVTKTSVATIVTGFTDAKGQFSVTVTSEKAAASESYTVDFYVLDGVGNDETWTNVNKTATTALYTATYADAVATTLVPESTVLAGANVTAKFTVKDQFGKATAVNGTKALSIELQAANSANLDKDAVVAADGTASFTFANYVTAGSSDVLTAKVYTGTSSSPTFLGGSLTKTLSLYNPGAASAVNAPASLSTDITYDDFITGTSNTTTNVAPNDGGVALTGTVVDANGTGIPGAVVTIAAKGLQFQKNGGTDYYVDSITVAADAAGAYNVNVWSHVVNTTGVAVSVTSGGKSATTTLKTYLPTGLNGNNLVFSLALPATIVKNTTYAVTAKLADKWGNPVATSTTGVNFQGTGSVEINSVSTQVAKTFDKNGQALVFVRSIKDIAGPGSVSAALAAGNYAATSSATATALTITEIATDVAATKWDETKFKNTIDTNVEVLEVAPAPAASAAASGSTGKFYASATNAAGKKVVVKVNGAFAKSFTGTAAKKVISVVAAKGTKTITIFVGGKLVKTQVVIVK